MGEEGQRSALQITLLNHFLNSIDTLWLPAGEPVGRYQFEGVTSFSIEAVDGYWRFFCKEGAYIGREEERVSSRAITGQDFFLVVEGNRKYAVFVEDYSEDNSRFHKYSLLQSTDLSIGRNADNDIQFDSGYVSGHHAVLKKREGGWLLVDDSSTNGTYVNNRRASSVSVGCGDVIFIMGLKIIIGVGFIALNTGNRKITLNPDKLRPMDPEPKRSVPPYSGTEEKMYNILPRRREPLKLTSIAVEEPPMGASAHKMPLVLRVGNNAISGASALMTGNVMSLVSSMLFPMMSNGFTDKERKEYEERRLEVYRKYLARISEDIEKEKQREERILRQNYPDTDTALNLAEQKVRLWERKKSDDDFLNIRIGKGDYDLLAQVAFPKERMSMDEDVLEDELRELQSHPAILKDVPVQTSLIEDFVCGVSGEEELRNVFLWNFIIQLVTFHSYDDVKLVVMGNEQNLKNFSFVRYLPHIWNDDRTFRFLAQDSSESYSIGEYLKGTYPSDSDSLNVNLEDRLKKNPYYVVIALDKKSLDSAEFLKNMIREKTNCGISVIASFDDLPKECSKIFRLDRETGNEAIYLRQLDRAPEHFRSDYCNTARLRGFARTLANTRLKTVQQAYTLPKMLTFLEMFGVGRIEHLNIENRWRQSNPIQSLATPVGVATDGSRFMLDLHQKYQGPHGLVAGTTGSGKSEFLLTYILSMAVNYHPDEVSFVLIDYKGGGLAGAFDDPVHGIHLPHLVGTITNLDGSSIRRSLVSIQSELVRRQRIFNEAKQGSSEGTMDIYTYQRLYRKGQVSEPMPHLFIISDEFAELKAQEPEFMEQLISAARIGRSLGIHLILATQKPSGVVNDQIRSNTKFRVCLKVQDKSDSNDMLMRPDAAALKDTGRFYLQVGYDEFFALGQSAWSGADYTPQDEVEVHRDDSLQLIDNVGRTRIEIKRKTKKAEKAGTQLVAVVRYLSEIAEKNGIRPRNLWKPAIPDLLTYKKLMEDYPEEGEENLICAYPGLVDDPQNQEQFRLKLNLQNANHLLLVGEPGCGKTTLVRTILYDLTARYTPEEVNYYLMDCSNHSLRVFAGAPHCGAWLTEEDGGDIRRLFKLLDRQIRHRKKLFSDAEVSGFDAYRKKAKLPLLIYVVDNVAALSEIDNEYYSGLGTYLKQCSGLGIQFVITASHLNELYSKTKQEIQTRVALELKDTYLYGDTLNAKCDYMPDRKKGRGLANVNGRLLEFQTAVFADPDLDTESQRAMIADLTKDYTGKNPIQRLPMKQEGMEYSEFCQGFSKGRIPLGYYLREMQPVALPLKQLDMLSVYFGNERGIRPVFENLLHAADKNRMQVWILRKPTGSVFTDMELPGDARVTECRKEALEDLIPELNDLLKERVPILQSYTRANGLQASRPDIYKDTYGYMSEAVQPVWIFIEDFCQFLAELKEDAVDRTFARIMQLSRNLGIYYVAGFYPEEKVNGAYETAKAFNPGMTELYFGGCYDKNPLKGMSSEFEKVDEKKPYNLGIMHYENKFYPIDMPCGEIGEEESEEDDRNIFE